MFEISIFAASAMNPQAGLLCSTATFMQLCCLCCHRQKLLNSFTEWPELCLRMLCCHVVLGSVHSSSHLFVPFLQTQYLWNTLRKCLSFLFMTFFLTKEWPGFDTPKVKSQSDRLCRCRWGSWFDSCLEYEGLGLKLLLLLLSEKPFFLQIQILGWGADKSVF